ncbi:hypothetical protein AHF37_08782 [Paragonimus kellicotti]|nr:hypothetical protein AHF37_08782 [Paragonimus kellicotti]
MSIFNPYRIGLWLISICLTDYCLSKSCKRCAWCHRVIQGCETIQWNWNKGQPPAELKSIPTGGVRKETIFDCQKLCLNTEGCMSMVFGLLSRPMNGERAHTTKRIGKRTQLEALIEGGSTKSKTNDAEFRICEIFREVTAQADLLPSEQLAYFHWTCCGRPMNGERAHTTKRIGKRTQLEALVEGGSTKSKTNDAEFRICEIFREVTAQADLLPSEQLAYFHWTCCGR